MRLCLCVAAICCLTIANTTRAQAPVEDQEQLVEAEMTRLRALTPTTSGADSPEAAISQLIFLSKAGDADAILALIEPKVRPIIALEVAAERATHQGRLLDEVVNLTLNGKPPMRFGFSIIFAESDLTRTKDMRILQQRRVDEDRIALRVLRTSIPFEGGDEQTSEQDVLAVRRDGRWYLFYLIGGMQWIFQEPPTDNSKLTGKDSQPVLTINRPGNANGVANSPQLVEVLSVPIEDIHAKLQVSAGSKLLVVGEEAIQIHNRLLNGLNSRLMRGEFEDTKVWTKLERPDQDALNIAMGTWAMCVREAMKSVRKTDGPAQPPAIPAATPK